MQNFQQTEEEKSQLITDNIQGQEDLLKKRLEARKNKKNRPKKLTGSLTEIDNQNESNNILFFTEQDELNNNNNNNF